MKEFLKEQYGIEVKRSKKLNGYISTNFSLHTDSETFLLKLYPDDEHIVNEIEAENRLMTYLSDQNPKGFQRPVPTKYNAQLGFDSTSALPISRLLEYKEGVFLAEAEHTEILFRSFGEFLAKMDLHLIDYRDPSIESKNMIWDLQNVHLNKSLIQEIPNPSRRKLVEYFFLQFETHAFHKLHNLRKSVIHNDANDWNVLCDNNKVTSIIDFGDIVYSQLINNLAIAISYIIGDKVNPLHWASLVVSSYHKTYPLEPDEIDLLYYLIAARASVSLSNSAQARKLDPENEYISVSEENYWKLLNKWVAISPIKAQNAFRKACGFRTMAVENIDKVLESRKKVISSIFSISYENPIQMQGAAFQYMYGSDGTSYLDAYNNIPHVGHCHPKIVNAAHKQMAQLNTNTRYLYDQLHQYAEKLLSKFPGSLNKVYFVNSGSAATDLAIRLARKFTGNQSIAVLEHGYHGNTASAIEISHYKYGHKGGLGKSDGVIQFPLADTYRGTHLINDGTAGKQYADEAIAQLSNTKLAAFIAEPIVGCGGQIPLAKGYLQNLYPAIKKNGGVCISDEVQTGFGRLGDHFWGFEMHGVTPDIVVLGKPMGNGHPIGAVVTTDVIAETFDNGMEFFSSFGGNPVSCVIGEAVLDVLEQEGLPQNAKEVGGYFKSILSELMLQHTMIGDIRGSGLFLGIDLVLDRENKKPATRLAQNLKNELRDRSILVSTDGPADNVIKMKPPLCFTKENAQRVCEEINLILNDSKTN